MSSRLYRAIVGVGISLGTTMGACSGAVDTSADLADKEAPDTRDTPDGSLRSEPARSDAAAGGDVDSSTRSDGEANDADASKDAAKDAILDAFCDAAWPTTKGNSGGPTCGPIDACAGAGPAPRCYESLAPSVCNATSRPLFSAWCVGGQWECSTGSVPETSCACWGPLEAGASCP